MIVFTTRKINTYSTGDTSKLNKPTKIIQTQF